MESKIEHNCNKCQHGYFADYDFSGYHNLCGAGKCYLCHMNIGGKCSDYIEGEPPKDKEQM